MDLNKYKSNLPEDVIVFSKIIKEKIDPIKKEIFSFNEISYIMNNIASFPVKADEYYTIRYDNEEENSLLAMLALSYIAYKGYKENKKTNINISKDDLYYTMNFIKNFFEYNSPIKDQSKSHILWIFPKMETKRYLANCINENNFDRFYYEEDTLTKLILIMTGFTKYEYNNVDENIENEINELNLPTLILANIRLYERGILNLTSEKGNVSISLKPSPLVANKRIFTENSHKVKEKIINVVNQLEGEEYTINDFIE
ncbi:hypothetical protein [Dethiothermospora halolimnae]|uniref:hypothetical protein n=1 Tax=Dethiothermospora halolimnae TaxID=3114390 RepID=UPI003CCBB27D